MDYYITDWGKIGKFCCLHLNFWLKSTQTQDNIKYLCGTSTIWKCFDLHETYSRLTMWLEFHGRGLRRGLCLAQASLWERRERWRWGRRRAWCWSWPRWSWRWACWGTATARCLSHPAADRSQLTPQGSWRRAPHSQHCCLILWRIQQTARGHQSHNSEQLCFDIPI